jgi:hypothetical protein
MVKFNEKEGGASTGPTGGNIFKKTDTASLGNSGTKEVWNDVKARNTITRRISTFASGLLQQSDGGNDVELGQQVWVRNNNRELWIAGEVVGFASWRGKPLVRPFSWDVSEKGVVWQQISREPPEQFGIYPTKLMMSVFQGRCRRSFITGRITFGEEQPLTADTDIALIDLYRRKTKNTVTGEAGMTEYQTDLYLLERDKYMFKPVPLVYRTWTADGNFKELCKEDARLTHTDVAIKALQTRVNDSSDTFAQQSCVKIWALFLFPAQFLGSLSMVLTILALFPTLSVLGYLMNNPRQYKYERLVSSPFRYYVVAYVVQLAATLGTMLSQQEYMRCLGTVVGLCLLIMDVLVDLAAILSFYTDTKYKVVEQLGHGVMLCQRDGGSITGKDSHSRLRQLAPSIKDPLIIILLEGLLCELKPVEPSEWSNAKGNRQMLRLVQCPVFDHLNPVWQPPFGGESHAERVAANQEFGR